MRIFSVSGISFLTCKGKQTAFAFDESDGRLTRCSQTIFSPVKRRLTLLFVCFDVVVIIVWSL